MMRIFAIAAACVTLLWPEISLAHTASESFISIRQAAPQHWRVLMDVDLRELNQGLALDANLDGQLTFGEIRTAQQAIAALALSRTHFSTAASDCRSHSVDAISIAEHGSGPFARLTLDVECNDDALQIDHSAWFVSDAGHRALLQYTSADGIESHSLLSQNSPIWRVGEGFLSHLFRFFREGARHLLTGYDHLAFLAVLLLALMRRRDPQVELQIWPTLRHAAGIITAFTIAHSLTLILAASRTISLPIQPVEIAIAGSVAMSGALNLWRQAGRHAIKWAFCFGLVHGLGFATALAEITRQKLDLMAIGAFNLGIEGAQIAVAAIALPLLWMALRGTRGDRVGVPLLSIGVAVLALGWVTTRISGLS